MEGKAACGATLQRVRLWSAKHSFLIVFNPNLTRTEWQSRLRGLLQGCTAAGAAPQPRFQSSGKVTPGRGQGRAAAGAVLVAKSFHLVCCTRQVPTSKAEGKAACEAALQGVRVDIGTDPFSIRSLKPRYCPVQELGLPVRADVPLLGFIGRLDYQKGVDIIRDSFDWLMSEGCQLILLGSGREDLENSLRCAYAKHVKNLVYDIALNAPSLSQIVPSGATSTAPSARIKACARQPLERPDALWRSCSVAPASPPAPTALSCFTKHAANHSTNHTHQKHTINSRTMLRREMEGNRKDQCRGWVGFSSAMAHRITAGADILLMPSRFEPCGLNQVGRAERVFGLRLVSNLPCHLRQA